MGILGIRNRTENWKTARTFAPFLESAVLRQKLARHLDEPEETAAKDVKLELFWKGVRDYLNSRKPQGAKEGWDKNHRETFRRAFEKRFGQLRGLVDDHERLTLSKDHSYSIAEGNPDKLYSNLRNNEIDIVLETPSHIYIGEAKDEMGFGYDGDLVLVHQLIRQYVTAKLLMDVIGSDKNLVQFVVVNGDKLPNTKKTYQVTFALERGWLKEGHILTWDQIADVAGSVTS